MFTRNFFAQTFDCTVRFCAACPKNKFPYGNLLKICNRCRSFCASCHAEGEPFSVPVSAQMWGNLGRILVHKCRECLFFPFGTMIVPSLGLFRYIIDPFWGICFSVPLLVQEMYQNKPKSGTFSAPEKFNPDLVQSVAHSAPKDGTLPA